MAAPAEVTLRDLSGKWVMNSALSDSTDSVLALQGLSWILRRTLSIATVTLAIKSTTDATTGHTHIAISQSTMGQTIVEERVLDWEPREQVNMLFGASTLQCRWTALEEIEDELLREGLEEGTVEVMETKVVNEGKGWVGEQVWGFEVVGGERRYVRHAIVRKGEEVARVRLVYDWAGKEQ